MKNLSNEDLLEYKRLFDTGLSKSKRFESRKIHNVDVKFLYHIVRLCDECEQILETHDLNLQRAKEHMKAVRRGEWTQEQVLSWFADKEVHLEDLYNKSTLRYKPDQEQIKQLLLKCLEEYFGSMDKCVVNQTKERVILNQIKELVENA